MERLGYDRYGAHGNDAGSMISPELGRIDPEHVVGVHVTQIFSFPSGDPAEFEGMTPDELRRMRVLQWFDEEMSAFNKLQASKPQTLAHALPTRRPGCWRGTRSCSATASSDDFVLTNVAIYWLTNTAASADRFYYEDAQAEQPDRADHRPHRPGQLRGRLQPLRRFADRDHTNIVSWNVYDRGGHCAAHEAPDLLVGDIRQFFRRFR